MPLPNPEPGLVIRYSYLWRDEKRRGQEEGEKDRPCVILSVSEDQSGDTVIRVVPFTRTRPKDPSGAIELPTRVGAHLGLRDDRQWIVVDETNRFTWPGPDIRRVPDSDPGKEFEHGLLPGNLFRRVRDRFVARAREGRAHSVDRDG